MKSLRLDESWDESDMASRNIEFGGKDMAPVTTHGNLPEILTAPRKSENLRDERMVNRRERYIIGVRLMMRGKGER